MADDSIFFGDTGFDPALTPPAPAQQWTATPQTYNVFTPQEHTFGPPGQQRLGEGTDFDSEPPLLEELGINFDHIKKKTIAVLNPFTKRFIHSVHSAHLTDSIQTYSQIVTWRVQLYLVSFLVSPKPW
jgi:hypothetical protein